MTGGCRDSFAVCWLTTDQIWLRFAQYVEASFCLIIYSVDSRLIGKGNMGRRKILGSRDKTAVRNPATGEQTPPELVLLTEKEPAVR